MLRSLLLLAAAMTILGCGSDSGEAPASHTVSENGVMHMPGLGNPTVNCTGCHGSSLQGGAGPSCTSCHGVKW